MLWSYLSPELMCRIMREVPGVLGVKQSAGDLKLLADLLIITSLTRNSADSGGGVYGGTLFNCVLIGNSANAGGGLRGQT